MGIEVQIIFGFEINFNFKMKNVAFCFVLIFIQCILTVSGDTDDIKVTPQDFQAVKNSLDFSGKVVLVTGSNSGIGATTVRLFSYLGAKVVVTGRNKTRVKQVANECSELSPKSIKPLAIALDLTIPGNARKLVNETIKRFKKIDVLINNVGIFKSATIQDPNFNDIFSQVMAINEGVNKEVTRLAAPYLSNTNGSIVFTTSVSARIADQSTAAYSMSKNSLIAFANALSKNLGPGVRVNVVSPIVVDGTRIYRFYPSLRQISIDYTIATSTLKRPAVPMDIAKAMVFLASPLAVYMTGQELLLNGGV